MMKNVKFGLGIATGTEGLMYPIPYASSREIIDISVLAEKLGFDSVWGNDHISSQNYVREQFGKAPRYYSPLLTLAAIAEHTTTLKLATALLVIPFRNPLVMAKEIATLDELSGGRTILGIGLGAYREEFEAEFGRFAGEMNRGRMLNESLEIMTHLFKEDNVTIDGEYFSINNAQTYPKPIQSPFPFYFGGNSRNSFERVVKWGTGWLPALLTPQEIKEGVAAIRELCDQYGRDFNEIEIAPQLSIAICNTTEEAVKRFESSQIYRHSISLSGSTMKGKDPTDYMHRNLVGSVDHVREQVEAYMEAGVTTFSALIFADETLDQTKEHIQFFSENIIRHYCK